MAIAFGSKKLLPSKLVLLGLGGCAAIWLFALVTVVVAEKVMVHSQKEGLIQSSHGIISTALREAFRFHNWARIQMDLIEEGELISEWDVKGVWLLGQDKKVIAQKNNQVKPDFSQFEIIYKSKEQYNFDLSEVEIGRSPTILHFSRVDEVYVRIDYHYNQEFKGEVLIWIDMKKENTFLRSLFVFIFWGALIFSLLYIGIVFFLDSNIFKPFANIKLHLDGIVHGKFIEIPEVKGSSILLQMSRDVNALIRELKDYQIKQKETQSRTIMTKTVQMIVHDIRKPFLNLYLILEGIVRGKDDRILIQQSRSYLPHLEKTLNNVDDMIQQVLKIGKEIEVQCQNVDPKSKIKEALAQVFSLKKVRNCEVTLRLEHTHFLWVDPIKFSHIIVNILENAVEAMGENNRAIVIETKMNPDNMLLVIRNSGSYIAASDREKVFEYFFTQGKSTGNGLGLAIVQQMVLAHGGKVWCQSYKEKNETEFCMTLPISKDKIDPCREIMLIQSADYIIEEPKNEADLSVR